MSTDERVLWSEMSGPDRRHALAVAREVAASFGHGDGTAVPTAVLAAALLHDCGKVESGLGTFGRVAATSAVMVLGRERVAGWTTIEGGWRGRFGRYVGHDVAGRRLLEGARSAPLVSGWAGEHHLPEDRWSVDPEIGRVLKAADDD
jgi:HD domain